MTHAFTMMTAREQPKRYGWWKNELESLGLRIKKTNEFNDLKEISNLVEILKQGSYVDYKTGIQ
jgi:hypothetical protein